VFVPGVGAATAGNSGLAEVEPAAPGAAGKVDPLGSLERAGPELLQPKHNVIQTVELTNSSRGLVGMSAHLSQRRLARATGCNAARMKRTELGRVFALDSPKRRHRIGQK